MVKPILVLCIDRDNDLYEKAKVSGPLIGREENLEAATKLALADPEDTDANSIFSAIRIYDQMKAEKKSVEIATLTGHKKLGYKADLEISGQLNRILAEIPAESCVFVSDGASDEEIMPIIRSRIKIDSTKIVVMKQAKELEKTYFVMLEKLKDPYYARIIFGVPAVLLLLFSVSSILELGWKPVGVLVGLYLLMKGFGIEEHFFGLGREFRFSIEKTSWLAYISAFALLLISFWAAHEAYVDSFELGLDGGKTVAYVLKSMLFLFPWMLLLIIGGKAIDAMAENRKFIITRYALYAVAVLLSAMILSIGTQWVLNLDEPYVGFGDFLLSIAVGMVVGYASITLIGMIRKASVLSMKLEGREVINENGNFIGRVVGVDPRKEQLVLQNQLGRKFNLAFRHIYSIEES
ncbi:MAG TPA: DUF373 family protein, partial [Candidatus Bilamarchaeaceae archaeon]|nr:DUF373 family protein [Candidatus Bilamarchaeaceae archaeon]